jgi:hypothetical protein
MIVFHYFYEKSGRPKFYQPVVDLMRAAHQSCMDDATLHTFIYTLRWKLEEVKPSGHGAHINFSAGSDGFIHLESGKVDEDIARLQYFAIRKNLSWDYSKDTFFELPPPVL